MARRRRAPVRRITPDPLFESELIARFTRYIMRSGKKSIAERIVYGALEQVQLTLLQKAGGSDKADDDDKGGEGKGGAAKKPTKESIITSERARKLALEKFEEVLGKISPLVEVRSRRVGGATYQVPVEVRPKRRMALAMRWLVQNACARNEKTMTLRLAYEILDALEGRGGAMKQRENVHRMAKANQAFAHYRW